MNLEWNYEVNSVLVKKEKSNWSKKYTEKDATSIQSSIAIINFALKVLWVYLVTVAASEKKISTERGHLTMNDTSNNNRRGSVEGVIQRCGLCSMLSSLLRRAMCVGSRRGSGESYYQELADTAVSSRLFSFNNYLMQKWNQSVVAESKDSLKFVNNLVNVIHKFFINLLL